MGKTSDQELQAAVRGEISLSLRDMRSPTAKQIAQRLGFSLRTFQRRLLVEGTSFAALLDDTRRKEALRLLAEGNLSLTNVARKLGYREQRSLSRSVRRWTGHSPRHHLAKAGAE